jgi:hypothetical protein
MNGKNKYKRFLRIGYTKNDMDIKAFRTLEDATRNVVSTSNIEIYELDLTTDETKKVAWYDFEDQQWMSMKTITKEVKITKYIPLGKNEWDVEFPTR